MTVYARQIATAQRLIAAKGKAVTWLTYATQDGVDPDKPWNKTFAQFPVAETPVRIVFLPYDSLTVRGRQTGGSRVGDEDIPEGNFWGLMGAVAGLTPSRFDTVQDGANVLAIAAIDLLAPDGAPILYSIRFKGAQPS